jgi:hypothetical protein
MNRLRVAVVRCKRLVYELGEISEIKKKITSVVGNRY